MYISWALPAADMKLQTIWTKSEEFYKPQSNVVHARFDLLTSFSKATEILMSGKMQYKCTFHYGSTPQKLPQFSPEISFGSLCQTLSLSPKTVNNGNTDLAQYPAAQVQHMAKN